MFAKQDECQIFPHAGRKRRLEGREKEDSIGSCQRDERRRHVCKALEPEEENEEEGCFVEKVRNLLPSFFSCLAFGARKSNLHASKEEGKRVKGKKGVIERD